MALNIHKVESNKADLIINEMSKTEKETNSSIETIKSLNKAKEKSDNRPIKQSAVVQKPNKIGRPRKIPEGQESFKATATISESLKNEMQKAMSCRSLTMSEYITYLIKKDVEENKSEYDKIIKYINQFQSKQKI